ncbi:hypothetical protein DFH08DRAFT_824613 [Mycena albidolilacea]|uniref:Uncharacterized protein n=1 Tax=Mycena albidolilacea TaxID=1033008 RepID=A0AAD6Z4M1_9AGAR|nr:hypothetical protein DFH08DRAFT_824613 [Mycena albidolilacea]
MYSIRSTGTNELLHFWIYLKRYRKNLIEKLPILPRSSLGVGLVQYHCYSYPSYFGIGTLHGLILAVMEDDSPTPLGHRLSNQEMNTIHAHNFKVNIYLGSRAYAKIKHAFPLRDLPSLSQLQSQITFISGINGWFHK